ncbi:MAG: hypothetical protein ACJ76V_05610, partial [Thermoleophilaceae bacterium]
MGSQRALIAFLPTKPAPKQPLLAQFERRGMSIGLLSPTLGGFSRTQMALDISQGTRISTRAYTKKLPTVAFVPQGNGGRIDGWSDVLSRADKAPGDIVPGLLASTIEAGGGHVAYAGAVGTNQVEAIAAANLRGRVQGASLGTIGTVGQRAVALWRRSSLVVTRLPDDADGLRALDQILAARRSRDLVFVVRAPPSGLRLLPAGMIGPGFHGGELRSATTRRDGLITATDVSPTILSFLGLKVPSKMEGERITAVRGGGAKQLQDLSARLDVVMTRRLSVFRDIVIAWLVVIALLFAVRRGPGLRAGARIAFLGALWLPVIALATAALRPGKMTESLILAAASVVLGAVTDRLMPWPAAAALPAFVS